MRHPTSAGRVGAISIAGLLCLAAVPGWAQVRAPEPSLDPRGFGAVGDGRSHPIGRQFGDTAEAASVWRDKSGGRPHAWMADPRFGLRFSMTASAAQPAPGRVAAFNTSVPTIFGVQQFAQFNGDPAEGQKQLAVGWLVAGPGIPPGTAVAGFDVAAGTVTFTQATTSPLAQGASVQFTIPQAAFQALEADYVGVQAAMVAASARGGGVVPLPAGDYRWNRTVWNPGAADGPSLRGNASLVGADLTSSRVEFTADLGPGGCALGERNRGPGSVGLAVYANFRMLGPGQPHNDGARVAGMDGLCVGQSARVDQVSIQRFHAGIAIVKDHGVLSRVDVSNNDYGVYFAPNGDSIGNWEVRDSGLTDESWAGIAVAWNNQIDFSSFHNLDLGGGSPYALYRERTPPGRAQAAGFLSNSVLEHIFSERVGLGWIYAENASDQIDRNLCLHCIAWMDPAQFKISGRSARAVMLAGRITGNTFVASDWSNGGAHFAIVSDAIVVAGNNIQSNHWGDLTEAVLNAPPRKPFLAAPTVLFNDFDNDRGGGLFLRAEAPLAAGQLLGAGVSAFGSGVRPLREGRVFKGVAGQAADAGQLLPVLTRGLATVQKTRDRAIAQGEPVAPSGTTPAAVTAASAGSGPVIGVWEDAGNAAADAPSGVIDLMATPR